MKSLIGALVAGRSTAPPFAYSPRSTSAITSGYGGAGLTLMSAMGANGTLFSIVNRTSNATSQVEWKLWRKAKSGKKEDRKEVTSHLALDLLRMPNPFMPWQLFCETFQQHIDLVGEGAWVVSHNSFGWPDGMWPVRPDRLQCVPGEQGGLVGYIYHDGNGTQIPLSLHEVIRLRMPNPLDPGPAGRGMGAVQTILSQLEGVHFSAQWNRNFFANSAMPGGVISVPETLDDNSFRRLQEQWSEQHRGVSKAHRVAIMEGGSTFTTTATQKDMQFVELQDVSRDVIREAFGMPKFMLGLVDDVNRASADASDAMFGTWLQTPRLERIKGALNTQYLPQFGATGHGYGQPDVEFDYESPVPPNVDTEIAQLTARVNAYVSLVGSGVTPADAALAVDLPEMEHEEPEPVPAALEAAPNQEEEEVPADEREAA